MVVAWSTRQLADLAGTTLKTVRHYHQIGLIDEPARTSNGYKQYGVAHLVRLLRIKRLVDLGVPLSQIGAMERADEDPTEALRVIDAALDISIQRLHQVKAELATVLRHRSPTDLPPGFSDTPARLTDADRALLLICSRILDQAALDDLRQILQESHDNPLGSEFDTLPPDADEPTRQQLAERYAPFVQDLKTRFPWLRKPSTRAAHGRAAAENVLEQAVADLYNPAQLDVMQRSHQIVDSRCDDEPA